MMRTCLALLLLKGSDAKWTLTSYATGNCSGTATKTTEGDTGCGELAGKNTMMSFSCCKDGDFMIAGYGKAECAGDVVYYKKSSIETCTAGGQDTSSKYSCAAATDECKFDENVVTRTTYTDNTCTTPDASSGTSEFYPATGKCLLAGDGTSGTRTCSGGALTYEAFNSTDCSGDKIEKDSEVYKDGDCVEPSGSGGDVKGIKVYCLGKGKEAPKAAKPGEVPQPPEEPCFSELATACRLTDAGAAPAAAFAECFGGAPPAVAERVPMRLLSAGDLVLASPSEITRVLVNQHAAAAVVSTVLVLEHATGSLALTPDHVLKIDGAFRPAAHAAPGSRLDPPSAVVTAVSRASHRVVNPLTTSGRILAAGPTGAPVVASVLPAWIAPLLLESTLYPLPFSLTAAASYLAPMRVQAFYDERLEGFFAQATVGLKDTNAAVPSPVALAILLGFDIALVASFAVWSLGPVELAVAALAVAAAAKARRAAKA